MLGSWNLSALLTLRSEIVDAFLTLLAPIHPKPEVEDDNTQEMFLSEKIDMWKRLADFDENQLEGDEVEIQLEPESENNTVNQADTVQPAMPPEIDPQVVVGSPAYLWLVANVHAGLLRYTPDKAMDCMSSIRTTVLNALPSSQVGSRWPYPRMLNIVVEMDWDTAHLVEHNASEPLAKVIPQDSYHHGLRHRRSVSPLCVLPFTDLAGKRAVLPLGDPAHHPLLPDEKLRMPRRHTSR